MSHRLSARVVVPLWIALVIACSLFTVGQAEASLHRVHLKAEPRPKIWQSAPVSTYRELLFSIIVNGRDVSDQGRAVGACRYLLDRPRLSVEVRTDCKRERAPTVVRYSGEVRFTFLWVLGGY